MRPGPATRAASFVDLPACLLTARSSETTLLVRQRSRGVPHLPVLVGSVDSRNRPCATSAVVSQQPNPFTEREVEEAAMPGQPARARARFRMSLAIRPRELPVCHWRHRNHRSTSLRVLTYSLNTLWGRKRRAATEKHFPLVQKLWT